MTIIKTVNGQSFATDELQISKENPLDIPIVKVDYKLCFFWWKPLKEGFVPLDKIVSLNK